MLNNAKWVFYPFAGKEWGMCTATRYWLGKAWRAFTVLITFFPKTCGSLQIMVRTVIALFSRCRVILFGGV